MHIHPTRLAAIALVGAAALTTPAAADMRLHGSSTVARVVVDPAKPQIEKALGEPLAVVTNGSGNGLKDAQGGRADVAMISAPLEVEVAIVNGGEPGALDPKELTVFPIGSTKLQFFVHPSNPATPTEAQVRDIFSGKITNWSQVGGSEAPIVVAIEKPLNGTRAVVQSALLKGGEFAPQARIAQALGQIGQIVGQLPTAIGYGNAASIEAGKVRILPGVTLDQPLSLVTRGRPTPAQEKLIAAVTAAAKSH